MLYLDREDAGRRLAERVTLRVVEPAVLVVALARGGVPVALEVAEAISAPVEVLVLQRLRMPGFRGLSLGAVTSLGNCAINQSLADSMHVPARMIQREISKTRANVARQAEACGLRPSRRPLAGWTVIVVDDGMTTGHSMLAAIAALRTRGPARIVIAVPVSSPDALAAVRDAADDLIFLAAPYPFHRESQFYLDLPEMTDEEIRQIVEARGSPESLALPGGTAPGVRDAVH